MFLILPKTLGCWNYHMIPVHSRAVFILPSGAKKEWQNSLRLFCRFFHYFAVDLLIILPV